MGLLASLAVADLPAILRILAVSYAGCDFPYMRQ
jgi:hypothetical protein